MQQPLEPGSAPTGWVDPGAQILVSLHLCGLNQGPSGTVDCELRIADLISSDMRSHEWIDERSLARDRQVAAKLQADPSLRGRARATLDRWLAQRASAAPAVLREWEEILSRWPLERILDLLASSDEYTRRLRQERKS